MDQGLEVRRWIGILGTSSKAHHPLCQSTIRKLGQSTVAKLGLLTKTKIKNCKKEEKDKTGASLALYASVLKTFEPKLEEAQRNELLRRMVSSDKLQ